jgi:hypothetical protein
VQASHQTTHIAVGHVEVENRQVEGGLEREQHDGLVVSARADADRTGAAQQTRHREPHQELVVYVEDAPVVDAPVVVDSRSTLLATTGVEFAADTCPPHHGHPLVPSARVPSEHARAWQSGHQAGHPQISGESAPEVRASGDDSVEPEI